MSASATRVASRHLSNSRRTRLIRLASERPDLRGHLLPLLKQGVSFEPGVEEYVERAVEKIVENLEDAGHPIESWHVDIGGGRWDLHRGAAFVVFLGVGDERAHTGQHKDLDTSAIFEDYLNRKFRVVHTERVTPAGRDEGTLYHCIYR